MNVSAQLILANEVNSANIIDFYLQNQQVNLASANLSTDLTVQMGTGNSMEISDKTPGSLALIQNGNYNTALFVNPSDYPTNTQIIVNGSGNHIDITGSNSISDGMKITINANDMTIFMRNY
ncbi:hypothetical protein KADA111694_03595 [Kaistella daneshvariae]